ncbi:MAG: hypothetical protein Q4G67_03570 [Actinomycetia bacterium]|nr:hypothetical protein [Actinomycetes bacterium]
MSTDNGPGELPTDERSALAWIMSGAVGAVVAGGIAKRLIDRRRERALGDAGDAAADVDASGLAASDVAASDVDEAEGHPS